MAIKIITDSTSYIPDYKIKKHDISVVSLSVNFEDASYSDLPDEFDEFYKKLESVNYIPKSSQPAFAYLYETFENIVKAGDDIVGVFLSSKMSGTFSTACIIKGQILEDYPDAKISIIDSQSNCMQMGTCVLRGCQAIEQGKTMDEVVSDINATIPKTRFIFSPDTLEYLRRGGRLGNAEAMIGQILRVKPILTVVDGMTTSLGKVRTRKKAISFMMETLSHDAQEFGLKNVTIHHIMALEEARVLSKKIATQFDLDHIDVVSIGPVIGTHVGPGAIGLVYETIEDIIIK